MWALSVSATCDQGLRAVRRPRDVRVTRARLRGREPRGHMGSEVGHRRDDEPRGARAVGREAGWATRSGTRGVTSRGARGLRDAGLNRCDNYVLRAARPSGLRGRAPGAARRRG